MSSLLETFSNNFPGWMGISFEDTLFLYNSCIEANAKNIVEIGTGEGFSTHILLLASTCPIITIDKDESWIDRGFDIDTSRIKQYKMLSNEYFETIANKDPIDFMFIDANLSEEDVLHIFERIDKKITIVLHDYVEPTYHTYPDKGNINEQMLYESASFLNYNIDKLTGREISKNPDDNFCVKMVIYR